jgi:predicted nucleic acid-binding protein
VLVLAIYGGKTLTPFVKETFTTAEAAMSDLLALGIEDRINMDSAFWKDVGGLKAVYRRVSLADCCALALARRLGARLETADRHEFEPILTAGISQIEFIR